MRCATRSNVGTRMRSGKAELAQSSAMQGRMIEVEQAGVEMAGHSRLEQIRASMRGDALPTGGTPLPLR